jgi:hypothetical protein
VIKEFREDDAIRQTPEASDEDKISEQLHDEFIDLLEHPEKRTVLGQNAATVMSRTDRDATKATVDRIRLLLSEKPKS